MWIFLDKEKPKKEKWYICLAVAISDFEIKYYPVIQKWQNGSFTPAGIKLTEISQPVNPNKSCKNAFPFSKLIAISFIAPTSVVLKFVIIFSFTLFDI